jgi:uncharacterized membrane protein
LAVHWPPKEALDRLMLILMPVALALELVAAFAGRFHWLAWLGRLAIAATAARILLHRIVYLTDFDPPDEKTWTTGQAWMILGGLAAALAVVWMAMVFLGRRTSGGSPAIAVACVVAGAALTAMLSGYATDPKFALALSAAIFGVVAASFIIAPQPDVSGVVGVGVVGLFAVLVISRFFASLPTPTAAILFAVPLLCWLPELPGRLQGVGGILMVAVPVLIVVVLAKQKFDDDSARPAPTTKGQSSSDGYDASDYDMYKH